MNKHSTSLLCAATLFLVCDHAVAVPHPVLYSGVVGAPTANCPGGGVFQGPGGTPFTKIAVPPFGSSWAIMARRENATPGYFDRVVLRGNGMDGELIAQTGDVLPAPFAPLTFATTTSGFRASDLSINAEGLVAWIGQSTGTPKNLIVTSFGGGAVNVVRKGGDNAPGLLDTLGGVPVAATFNDTSALAFTGLTLLNNDQVAFQANFINGPSTNYQSVAYTNSANAATDLLNQQGVTAVPDADFGYLFQHAAGTLQTNRFGTEWVLRGAQLTVGTAPVLVRNGSEELEAFGVLPPYSAGISAGSGGLGTPKMAFNGDWYTPGQNTDNQRWLARNGVVIAEGGAPITPGNIETYVTDRAFLVIPSPSGRYAVQNFTDTTVGAEKRVVVVDGTLIVARNHDAVDVNNNGLADDDAFINSFNAVDSAFGADDVLYLIVTLKNGVGADIGSAVLFIQVPPVVVGNGGCQPADIADDTGEPLPSAGSNTGVNEGDYNAFFAGFFDALPYCDQWDDAGIPLTEPGAGVNNGVNEGDYNGFFATFFDGCP